MRKYLPVSVPDMVQRLGTPKELKAVQTAIDQVMHWTLEAAEEKWPGLKSMLAELAEMETKAYREKGPMA